MMRSYSDVESKDLTLSRMDTEFDQLLMDLKPYVVKVQQKSDRQRCAVWIKKLCEPTGSTVSGKKNRNTYAQLMLRMLKRGSLEGPFINNPEFGPLPTLPAYMNKVPDWVTDELTGDLGFDRSSQSTFNRRPADDLYFTSSYDTAGSRLPSIVNDQFLSNGFQDIDRRPASTSQPFEDWPKLSDADNYRPRQNVSTTASSSRYQGPTDFSHDFLSTGPTYTTSLYNDVALTHAQSTELEIRTKMIESRFQEESLKLQHQHDSNVKKILDRKNSEIEEMKQRCRSKCQEQESVASQLEKKVAQLQQELTAVQEMRDHQIAELQRQTEENASSKQSLLDKKLHDMSLEHEQQKYELQKRHTAAIQELMEETNAKLAKMQADYDQLTESTSSVITELESRVQQLSLEADNIDRAKQQLEKSKADLEVQIEKLQTELLESRNRLTVKDKELRKLQTDHEEEMWSYKNKSEAANQALRDEHRTALAKATDTIHGLERQISELNETLEAAEQRRLKEVKELAAAHDKNVRELEDVHQAKRESLQQKLHQQEKLTAKQLNKLEQVLSHKEEEIHRLTTAQLDQAEHAQRALDEFKGQVEKNSAKMYEDMKSQIEKVESELNRSKQLREKQTREFERQRDDLQQSHASQLTELKMKSDMERARLLEDFHTQAEVRRAEKEKELAAIRESLQADVADAERRARERTEKDTKLRAQLETQLQRLRDELIQVNQQRKHELMELRLLRDQEKHTLQSECETQTSRLSSRMEEQRLELEKRHNAEMEKLLESTNRRLKEIETDYVERSSKDAETISELKSTVERLKSDISRKNQELEQHMSAAEEEKRQLRQQYLDKLAEVQQDLEKQKEAVRQLEKLMCQQQLDDEEKELEDTISSLRMQVGFLQQRAATLQEDLNLRNVGRLTQNGVTATVQANS